jgi:hypothetical protein
MPQEQPITATNPTTGQKIWWNGSDWVPIRAETPSVPSLPSLYDRVKDLSVKLGRGTITGIESGAGIPDTETPLRDFIKNLVSAGETAVMGAGPRGHREGGPYTGIPAVLMGIPKGLSGAVKESYSGIRAKDPEHSAHGLASLLTQIALLKGLGGKEGPVVSKAIEEARAASPGVVKIAGREIPVTRGQVTGPEGNWAQRASRTMESSVVGGPIKKVIAQQQSIARQMISDFSAESGGILSLDPDQFVANIGKNADARKIMADQLYGSIRNDLGESRGASVMFDKLQRDFSDTGTKMRAAYRSGMKGTLNDYFDYKKLHEEQEEGIGQFIKDQGKPELWERWLAARDASRTQHALQDLRDAVDSVVKGLDTAQMKIPNVTPRPQQIPAGQLLEKLKDMNARLDQALTPEHSMDLKRHMQIMTNSESRGAMGGIYAHYLVSAGPMVGAAEEVIRRGLIGGNLDAAFGGAAGMLALYPALWAFSKMLSYPSGRVALLNFLRSAVGTPAEAAARQQTLGVLSILARQSQQKGD